MKLVLLLAACTKLPVSYDYAWWKAFHISVCHASDHLFDQTAWGETGAYTAQKKWSFPLTISSWNVSKSAVCCGFGHIYWRNP